MSQNKRSFQSASTVLELPTAEEARKKIASSILQWESQLSEEQSKTPGSRRSEAISRLNIRLEIARTLLKTGRCQLHKLQSIKAAADHIVANAFSCLRLMLKPYQVVSPA